MSEHDDPVGSGQHGGDPRDDAIGSAAEEAAKLLGVLGEWARSLRDDLDEHVATGAPECTYCPICRTVHVLRDAGPDVRTHLASAASSLMQAAAAVVASVANSGAPPRSATVQTIDLDSEDDSWEDDR